MRQYINTVKRLFEGDILPFTARREPIHRDAPAGEVVPFPSTEPEPKRFRVIVYAVNPQGPGKPPKMQLIDDVGDLSVEDAATQLKNYRPTKQKDNLWISAPIKSKGVTTYFYAHLLVGENPPRHHDMEEIGRLMATA